MTGSSGPGCERVYFDFARSSEVGAVTSTGIQLGGPSVIALSKVSNLSCFQNQDHTSSYYGLATITACEQDEKPSLNVYVSTGPINEL